VNNREGVHESARSVKGTAPELQGRHRRHRAYIEGRREAAASVWEMFKTGAEGHRKRRSDVSDELRTVRMPLRLRRDFRGGMGGVRRDLLQRSISTRGDEGRSRSNHAKGQKQARGQAIEGRIRVPQLGNKPEMMIIEGGAGVIPPRCGDGKLDGGPVRDLGPETETSTAACQPEPTA